MKNCICIFNKDAPWKDVTKLKYIEELTKILDV